MKKIIEHIGLKQLYLISFIEGGVVMVTEITGARILTPYFGASLYSWAATLSITLFALMSGYYFGGYATTKAKYSGSDKIIWIFILSGFAVLLMPSLGTFIMQKTISFSFFTGLIISELFFLFLPIFLMGMISPMIIFHITKKVELSGRSAGNIYAISTSGGIIFTLAFGFLIIPHFGITFPLRTLGVFVAMLGLVILLREKISAKIVPLVIFFLLLLAAYIFNQKKYQEFFPQTSTRILEYSEGLLGELKVVDQITYPANSKPVTLRKLKINNIQQDYVFKDMTSQSLMFYVNFSKQLVKFLPKKKSTLIIGLGSGSLYTILKDDSTDVESVEIDKRIYDMGVKYFNMPEHKDHHITDGRYFINVTKKKYDLIVLDVIIGENVPGQLITLESFKRCFELLNENGSLLIEHGGIGSFADNSFVPSIDKTLKTAGFNVRIFNPLASEIKGDVLFLATKNTFETKGLHIKDDVFMKGGLLTDFELTLNTFNNKEVDLLTDDKNKTDILLKSHYLGVRKGIRKELAKSISTKHS